LLIGATPEGRKKLSASPMALARARSTAHLLLDLKRRGLDVPPRLAIADGALGSGSRRRGLREKRASSAAGCTRPRT